MGKSVKMFSFFSLQCAFYCVRSYVHVCVFTVTAAFRYFIVVLLFSVFYVSNLVVCICIV